MYSCVQLCQVFATLWMVASVLGCSGKNTVVGFLLQQSFPDWALNPHLLCCRLILYCWAIRKPPQSRHYILWKSLFRLKNYQWHYWKCTMCNYTVDQEQLDHQLFLQKKKKRQGLLRIRKELQSRLCNHGKLQASPKRKWRRTLLMKWGGKFKGGI